MLNSCLPNTNIRGFLCYLLKVFKHITLTQPVIHILHVVIHTYHLNICGPESLSNTCSSLKWVKTSVDTNHSKFHFCILWRCKSSNNSEDFTWASFVVSVLYQYMSGKHRTNAPSWTDWIQLKLFRFWVKTLQETSQTYTFNNFSL